MFVEEQGLSQRKGSYLENIDDIKYHCKVLIVTRVEGNSG